METKTLLTEIKTILMDHLWNGHNTGEVNKAHRKIKKLLVRANVLSDILQKTCVFCEKEFFPSRSSQKYCPRCQGLSYAKLKGKL